MLNKKIEKFTEALLSKLGFLEIPIPIEEVAKKCGLSVSEYDFGNKDEVSGALFIKANSGTIAYNKEQHPNRQRFTIAHELGHFILHKGKRELFLDNRFVYFRNENSSTGEEVEEIEANSFAAAILMPKILIDRELSNKKVELWSDDELKPLADRFRVSSLALSIRLTRLGYI